MNKILKRLANCEGYGDGFWANQGLIMIKLASGDGWESIASLGIV